MKNVMKFSGFGVLFLVLVLLYLRYDKTGYYYGVECSFCNKNMPYGLTPKIKFDYPQSFCLLDEDGFELVGIGFRYKQSSFRIKNFLGYAYNDTSVLLKCTDSLNNIKYHLINVIQHNLFQRFIVIIISIITQTICKRI